MPCPSRITALLIIVTCASLAASTAAAQEASGLPGDRGAWALQFDVGDNFSLGSYLGSAVSVKKHTAPATAWQLGVSFDANVRSIDEDDDAARNDDAQSLQLNLQFMSYPLLADEPGREVQLLIGAGPLLGLARSHMSNEQEGARTTTTTTMWSTGVTGSIGAEWFFAERVSLHAAYVSSVVFARSSTEGERFGTELPEQTLNSFEFGSDGVRFGVSVYL